MDPSVEAVFDLKSINQINNNKPQINERKILYNLKQNGHILKFDRNNNNITKSIIPIPNMHHNPGIKHHNRGIMHHNRGNVVLISSRNRKKKQLLKQKIKSRKEKEQLQRIISIKRKLENDEKKLKKKQMRQNAKINNETRKLKNKLKNQRKKLKKLKK